MYLGISALDTNFLVYQGISTPDTNFLVYPGISAPNTKFIVYPGIGDPDTKTSRCILFSRLCRSQVYLDHRDLLLTVHTVYHKLILG